MALGASGVGPVVVFEVGPEPGLEAVDAAVGVVRALACVACCAVLIRGFVVGADSAGL